MRILVIEDDPAALNLLSRTLEVEGHKSSAFVNPLLGIEAYLKERFDAVITDIMMPVMNGLEVVQAIRDHDPTAKILVITGHADLEIANAAMTRGAYAFFVKPVDSTRLLNTLKMLASEIKS
jgi:DNA-binding NtrC family response regulator